MINLSESEIHECSQEKLNELTAVNLMGFKFIADFEEETANLEYPYVFKNKNGILELFLAKGEESSWNPTHDMNDAMMLASKFNFFYLYHWKEAMGSKWECKLTHVDERKYYALEETAALAITRAALLASLNK